jgi:outer membrane protein
MKKIKVLVLIAIVSLGLNTLNAQEKIGHISTDLLISLMPETKALNAELEKLGKTYEAELKAENDAFEAKLKKYDAEAASQTDEVNQSRRAEVQNDQQSLYQASQIAREDIGKKRDEKLKPILEKAKKAIDDVAKANGYKYVLEASTLVVANGTDILPLVKTKLGIQ